MFHGLSNMFAEYNAPAAHSIGGVVWLPGSLCWMYSVDNTCMTPVTSARAKSYNTPVDGRSITSDNAVVL